MTELHEQTPADSRGAAVRRRRARSWPVAAGVGAVVVVVLAVIFAVGGRGWFAASPGALPDPSTPGLLAKGDYQPRDQQQAGDCDGVPPVAPEDLRLLDPTATVSAAVVCTSDSADRPGDGRWLYRLVIDVPAGRIPALVAALTGPDVESVNGACTAMMVVVPDFVVTLSDGSRVRPGVPGDGCHPSEAAVSAIGSAAGPVRTSIPVSRIATQPEITSGCYGEGKAPAVWLGRGSQTGELRLPDSSSVSVCRYAAGSDMLGALSAVGTARTQSVSRLLAHPESQPPTGCPSPATDETSPPTDWLTIQGLPAPSPDRPAPAPLLVELGGCRRIVDGQHQALVGYLPAGSAEQLAALADQPVR